MPAIVLGIETSCDETAVALYHEQYGLLAHRLHSQAALHENYGGVVPELAARDHVNRILPLVRSALDDAQLTTGDITAVAHTAGPGLIGALLVGAAFATGFAFSRSLPLVPVHHLEGHLLAPMLEDDPPRFPFVALLASGGHTLLAEVKGIGCYRILGETLDDAAGEAFDKTAKLLGLPYPGGPHLAKLAEQGRTGRFHFRRPMTDRAGLDFSFSGLKTAVATALAAAGDAASKADLARAFEECIVDTLVIKCCRALEQTAYTRLVVAGGVSANHRLREQLIDKVTSRGGRAYFPRPDFCTDNAAMIAYAGWTRLAEARRSGPIIARSRWPLSELSAPTGNQSG